MSIGGDFGGKGFLVDEPLAYLLARATGRPVKMAMSYTEELLAGVPRHAAAITIKSGLTRDGRLVARHARLVFNSGAYGGHKPHPRSNLSGAESACGTYRIPHTLVESYCVYTNQVPCGHMRSPGSVQAVFAVESHTDMLAERLGLDPLEFRRLNVVEPSDLAPTDKRWEKPRVREVLERAAAEAGWREPRPGPTIGRGVALSSDTIGFGKSGAILSVRRAGR